MEVVRGVEDRPQCVTWLTGVGMTPLAPLAAEPRIMEDDPSETVIF